MYAVSLSIPRTEELHITPSLGRAAARTVYCVQVRSALPNLVPNGVTPVLLPPLRVQVTCTYATGHRREWQLKKRYGYFERLHRSIRALTHERLEAAALPKRKLLNHRSPKYLSTLRQALEAYLLDAGDVRALRGRAYRSTCSHASDRARARTAGRATRLGSVPRRRRQRADAARGAPRGTRTAPPATSSTWEARERVEEKVGVEVRERVAAAPMAAPSDRHRSPLRPPQIEGYLRKQGGSRSGKGQQWRRRRASGHPSPRPSAARRMQASRSPAERTRARAGTLHSAARRYTTTGTASSRSNRRALSS